MSPANHDLSRRLFLSGTAASSLVLLAGRPAYAAVDGGANLRVTGSVNGTTAHIQPTIAVNPRRPKRFFGACYALLDGVDTQNELTTYTSADGGRSWELGELPDSVELNDHGVTYGADGTGYLWADDGTLRVWRTEDDGKTFDGPVPAAQDARIDRAIIAADQDRRHAQQLFGVWGTDGNEAVGFSRSTDGARTFEPTRRIAHGQGTGLEWTACPEVTARCGVVHVTYGLWPRPATPTSAGSGSGGGDGGGGGQPTRGEMTGPIMVTTSRDGGTTFDQPRQLGIGTADLQVTSDTCTPSIPAVTAGADPRVAAVAYTQRNPQSGDLVICTTIDSGRSWTPPTPITASPPGVFYYQPRLTCDHAGRYALSASRITNGLLDTVLFTSPPGTPRFGPGHVVTSRPFDPRIGPPGKNGAWWLGDTQAIAATTNTIHPLWTDTRDGHLEIFTATVPWR